MNTMQILLREQLGVPPYADPRSHRQAKHWRIATISRQVIAYLRSLG